MSCHHVSLFLILFPRKFYFQMIKEESEWECESSAPFFFEAVFSLLCLTWSYNTRSSQPPGSPSKQPNCHQGLRIFLKLLHGSCSQSRGRVAMSNAGDEEDGQNYGEPDGKQTIKVIIVCVIVAICVCVAILLLVSSVFRFGSLSWSALIRMIIGSEFSELYVFHHGFLGRQLMMEVKLNPLPRRGPCLGKTHWVWHLPQECCTLSKFLWSL